jgi:hypothetical protein
MSHRVHHPWKQLIFSLCMVIAFAGCYKSKPAKNPEAERPVPPVASVYEAIVNEHGTSYCGTSFTSDLKIQNGITVGTVEVGNDSTNLYLTYNLSGSWYLISAQSYAGRESLIPTSANGNPNPDRFPGKKVLNACSRSQKLTFKIPMSLLETDNGSPCPGGAQYFVAMKASVKQIDNGDCNAGDEMDAWAAPVLINPGNSSEWATAFYYCKQECTPLTAPDTWCAYGQGYWFVKPNVVWCEPSVKFGSLEIIKDSARALWPAQNNIVRKAFFQASALQLSMICNNNNQAMPADIADDYEVLVNFLSGLTPQDIKNGTVPATTDVDAIKAATGNIGKWICQHNCNSTEDPTACSGE